MRTICILTLAVLAVGASPACADGGGGMFLGYQTSEYPFLERYDVTNNTMGLMYYGGFGYGVDWDGNIAGGFGFTIHQEPLPGDPVIAGGVGGFIAGRRLLARPLNLSLVTWTGVGGIGRGQTPQESAEGYFIGFVEIDLEVGIPITRWFMPVVYAGYQLAGNFVPGTLFETFVSYTPVIGARICWGKHY
jgi:hypothetical protein